MNISRLSLLAASILAVPLALVVGSAGPVAAAPPDPGFGSHVSSCAQGTGFSGQHNPSHHRAPTHGRHALAECMSVRLRRTG